METTFDKSMFAERLRKERKRAGFERQVDLARAADISSQAVSAYESGERLPSADVLCALARALGCTADYLVQLEDTAVRENAAISSYIGLTDKSIDLLRRYKCFSNSSGADQAFGEFAIDLVNCILELDQESFDKFVQAYNLLFVSIYAKAAREGSVESEEQEMAHAEKKIELVKQGLVLLDPDEAIDYQIRRIGDFLSKAVQIGTEKRVNDLDR